MQDETDLVVLMTVPREMEAQLIVDALEERGIEAQQAGGAISGFKIGAPAGVEIYVKAEDEERAIATLAQIREEADHIDWSKIDPEHQPADE